MHTLYIFDGNKRIHEPFVVDDSDRDAGNLTLYATNGGRRLATLHIEREDIDLYIDLLTAFNKVKTGKLILSDITPRTRKEPKYRHKRMRPRNTGRAHGIVETLEALRELEEKWADVWTKKRR